MHQLQMQIQSATLNLAACLKENLQSQPLVAKHLDQIERNKGQVVERESHSQCETTTVEPHTANIIHITVNREYFVSKIFRPIIFRVK